MNKTKQNLLIAFILILVIFGGYSGVNLYNNIQIQAHLDLKSVSAFPVEHYYTSTEKSCGIWYEKYSDLTESNNIIGPRNNNVENCFKKAVENCEPKSILIASDKQFASEEKSTYSFIQVIKQNDAEACIVQNYYQEIDFSKYADQLLPIAYVNTCTSLSDNLIETCQPDYIIENRKDNDETLLELND